MTAQAKGAALAGTAPDPSRADPSDAADGVNEVRLVGRVSAVPEQRGLPSGDSVWTFRLVVPRLPGGRTRQPVDTLDCAVWSGRARRSVATWAAGDIVEIRGALRRRFFRAAGAAVSRVEVDIATARVIRRAASG